MRRRTESLCVYDAAMPQDFHPTADELLANNADYAKTFDFRGMFGCTDTSSSDRGVHGPPACRFSESLALARGDAHIIRNAGGVVTDDVIRSLCLSQRAMGTREIILMHHTDCGLQKVSEDSFKSELEEELGIRPHWSVESFDDPYADVRQSMQTASSVAIHPRKEPHPRLRLRRHHRSARRGERLSGSWLVAPHSSAPLFLKLDFVRVFLTGLGWGRPRTSARTQRIERTRKELLDSHAPTLAQRSRRRHRVHRWLARSRSWYLRTLPLAFRGRASTNSICRGTL